MGSHIVLAILLLMAIATEAFHVPQFMRLQQRRPITLNSREVSQRVPTTLVTFPSKVSLSRYAVSADLISVRKVVG
eukprot:27689-Eustigmatos_ZCMA.PRE.1